MRDIFSALDLNEINAGAWSGDGGWSNDGSGPVIDSVNPTTGERLARVQNDLGRLDRTGRGLPDLQRIAFASTMKRAVTTAIE